MTENEIRQKVVATAKKYIGCNEQDGSHKKFISVRSEILRAKLKHLV